MPIREFVCRGKHTTEKILHGQADKRTQSVPCGEKGCRKKAKRVELSKISDRRAFDLDY